MANLVKMFETDDMLLALERQQGLVYLAAAELGCDTSTIYLRAKEDERVAKAIKQRKGRRVDIAEAQLFNQINEGNIRAIIFYLKTQGKDRGYIERLHRDFDAKKLYAFTDALEAMGQNVGDFMDKVIERSKLEGD